MNYLMLENRRDELTEQIEELYEKIKELEEERDDITSKLYQMDIDEQEREFRNTRF